MTTKLARVVVQHPFCSHCATPIKLKLMEVEHIRNVALFPKDSLVVFNFNRAHQISEVLNTLVALGYPPQGDRVSEERLVKSKCNCHNPAVLT